jgi:hypothetical protein|tara:strand:- start:591 stop:725 length:135 start_codon:yes stop_codon:yes gene_type:complete
VGSNENHSFEKLAMAENKAVTDILQRNAEKGLPCGTQSFMEKLE